MRQDKEVRRPNRNPNFNKISLGETSVKLDKTTCFTNQWTLNTAVINKSLYSERWKKVMVTSGQRLVVESPETCTSGLGNHGGTIVLCVQVVPSRGAAVSRLPGRVWRRSGGIFLTNTAYEKSALLRTTWEILQRMPWYIPSSNPDDSADNRWKHRGCLVNWNIKFYILRDKWWD